ncbi:MAG: DNA-binding transcriptional MerR regulator [Moritella sp.]|jgi:DNA-binding transcriptional MerR regulator
MQCEQIFSITQVSSQTSVNSITLRAWQRRYGLLTPQRNAQGHRFYQQADITRIQAILAWLDKGVSIGKVKALLDEPLLDQVTHEQLDEFEDFINALTDLNSNKLAQLFNEISKNYPFPVYLDKLLRPTLAFIHAEKNPLSNMQQAILRSVIIEKCAEIVTKQRSHNKQTCFLVGFEADDLLVWLQALNFSNQGYKVTVLGQLTEKLTGLEQMLIHNASPLLAIVGQTKLPVNVVTQLTRVINNSACDYCLLGNVTAIHASDFS